MCPFEREAEEQGATEEGLCSITWLSESIQQWEPQSWIPEPCEKIQKVPWKAFMEIRIWILLQTEQMMRGLRPIAKFSRILLPCLISSLASLSGSSGIPESLVH